jgi:hypothetical protein
VNEGDPENGRGDAVNDENFRLDEIIGQALTVNRSKWVGALIRNARHLFEGAWPRRLAQLRSLGNGCFGGRKSPSPRARCMTEKRR